MKTKTLIAMIVVCFGLSESAFAARLRFDDGGVHTIDYLIEEGVIIYNSTQGEPTTVNIVEGADIVGSFMSMEDSLLNISGGRIRSSLYVYGEQTYITGGAIVGNIGTYATSCTDIYGGVLTVSEVALWNFSTLTFHGSNFTLNGRSVYGTFTCPGLSFPNGASGRLTGILADGYSFDIAFRAYDFSSLVFIPEPATVALLGLGSLLLLRKKGSVR